MKISAKLLIDAGACTKQVDKFRQIFGNRSVTVTKRRCAQYSHVFDFRWAAVYLLDVRGLKAYRDSMSMTWDLTWAAYKDAMAQAFAAAAMRMK